MMKKKCVEKLVEKIMKEFDAFLAKTYNYLTSSNDGDKK